MASLRLGLRPSCLRALRTARTFSATRRILDSEPIVPALRNDLKTAMRNKNTPVSSVLRAVLSELSLNEKTGGPTTPMQFISALRTRIKTSQASQSQFRENDRQDLVQAEAEQEDILKGYLDRAEADAGGVVGPDEILQAVQEAARGGQKKMGDMMKTVLAAFEDRVVERAEVARVVKQVMGEK